MDGRKKKFTYPENEGSEVQINGINLGIAGGPDANNNGITISTTGSQGNNSNGISLSGIANIYYKTNGLSVAGLMNTSTRGNLIQIGLFNNCRYCRGIQIGLWNRMGKRELPFINFSFKKPNPIDEIIAEDSTWMKKHNKKKRSKKDHLIDHAAFKIEAGCWVPIGNLSNQIALSPNFGLWMGLPLSFKNQKTMVDIGTSFFIPSRSRNFQFQTTDSVFTTKAEHPGGVFGIQLTRTLLVKSRILNFIELSTGTGLGFINTSTKKVKAKNEDQYYSIKTMHFSLSVAVRKEIKDGRSIGVLFKYNYTPQQLFYKYVPTDFGNNSLVLTLQYKVFVN